VELCGGHGACRSFGDWQQGPLRIWTVYWRSREATPGRGNTMDSGAACWFIGGRGLTRGRPWPSRQPLHQSGAVLVRREAGGRGLEKSIKEQVE
jgi:hypothetical protein